MANKKYTTRLEAGLGELILQVLKFNAKQKLGIATREERIQHDLFIKALNEVTIPIGFDCDGDGIPDTLEIFATSANTSCCRIIPVEASRRAKAKQIKRGSRR